MTITTPQGILSAVSLPEYNADGRLIACRVNEKSPLLTPLGSLIPQYGEEHVRRRFTKSVSFYDSGKLHSIALENQTPIKTPLGVFPAELVTFYESGALKRLFPLNGKISGYWSEEDEAALVEPLAFDLPVGRFQAKIISLHFYGDGALKSLTLFPKQVLSLSTPAGRLPVRNGFSLYESGAVKSVEPAMPVPVMTPLGLIHAYDANAVGINADHTSLAFSETGAIKSLVTSTDDITVTDAANREILITPISTQAAEDDDAGEDELLLSPVSITFEQSRILFNLMTPLHFDLAKHRFSVSHVPLPFKTCASAACASCSGCSS